jgi:hypothetical protein
MLQEDLISFTCLQPDHVEALTQVEEAKEMAQAQQRLGPGARLEVRKARRPEG